MASAKAKSFVPFRHEKFLHEVDMELEKERLGLLSSVLLQFKRFVNPDIGREREGPIKVLDSDRSVLEDLLVAL